MIGTIGRADAVVVPRHIPDAIRARLAATVNPRHAAMLRTYLAHTEAEFDADIDAAMHTLVAEPVFRFWCGYRNPSGPMALERPTIRANYERVFAHGFPMIEIVPERFLVGDDGLVIEGEQRSIVTGQQLLDLGTVVQADAARDYYLVCRFALVVEFCDDLMLGEDHYWPAPHLVLEIVEDA